MDAQTRPGRGDHSAGAGGLLLLDWLGRSGAL